MENPATWGAAEKIIQAAYLDWNENMRKPASEAVIGLSLYRQIADALREAGLLNEESTGSSPHGPGRARNRPQPPSD